MTAFVVTDTLSIRFYVATHSESSIINLIAFSNRVFAMMLGT
jgi:hypothetical protein